MAKNTLTVDLPLDLDPEEARLLLSMKLFEAGKLSLGQAAEMAGHTKRAYIDLLSKQGISLFQYTPEELTQEWQAWQQRSLGSGPDG